MSKGFTGVVTVRVLKCPTLPKSISLCLYFFLGFSGSKIVGVV
jgi:hypothetical protein